MAQRRQAAASADLNALWAHHHAEWRDSAQITSQWQEASETDPRLLVATTDGQWWDVLAAAGITLLVTREYEHLVMALRADLSGPAVSYMRLPHPSGIAVDATRSTVTIASTRNPNQVYDLQPVSGMLDRLDRPSESDHERPLVPVRSRFFPGALYMHDLAYIGGDLYANSVGQNAIVRLGADGSHERVWWPRCIEQADGPVFGQNHIQLNSIAAGPDLAGSFFSASRDTISARRPGHRNFPVDKRGVIFSGASREPIARGLTRPHSARLHDGRLWVDNSGYGELSVIDDGRPEPVIKLPGWTRGLGFHGRVAFVGTSRVIPRFRQYAPGLDVDASRCGIHAVDLDTGHVLGSIFWPFGNQIFAIDWLPSTTTSGFPWRAGAKQSHEQATALFYAFQTSPQTDSASTVATTIQPGDPMLSRTALANIPGHDPGDALRDTTHENPGDDPGKEQV
jgi:uncharacterized protein (TIGR03032 family)